MNSIIEKMIRDTIPKTKHDAALNMMLDPNFTLGTFEQTRVKLNMGAGNLNRLITKIGFPNFQVFKYAFENGPLFVNTSQQPVAQPVVQPVAQPVVQPVAQPVVQPVAQPVVQPVAQPVVQPVAQQEEKPQPDVKAETRNNVNYYLVGRNVMASAGMKDLVEASNLVEGGRFYKEINNPNIKQGWFILMDKQSSVEVDDMLLKLYDSFEHPNKEEEWIHFMKRTRLVSIKPITNEKYKYFKKVVLENINRTEYDISAWNGKERAKRDMMRFFLDQKEIQ